MNLSPPLRPLEVEGHWSPTILLDWSQCFNRLPSRHLSLKDSRRLAVVASECCPRLDFGVRTG